MNSFLSKCCNAKLKVVYSKKDGGKDFWLCSECQNETEPLPSKNGFIPEIWPKPKKAK